MNRRGFLKALGAGIVALPLVLIGSELIDDGQPHANGKCKVYFDDKRTVALGGKFFHSASWNVELTDGEVRQLAEGISPYYIRPDNLLFYSPDEIKQSRNR